MYILALSDLSIKKYNLDVFNTWLNQKINTIDAVITLGNIDLPFLEAVNSLLYKKRNIVRLGVNGGRDRGDYLSEAGFWNLHMQEFNMGNTKIYGFEGVKSQPEKSFFAYNEDFVNEFIDLTHKSDLFITNSPSVDCDPNYGFKAFEEYLLRAKPKYHIFSYKQERQFNFNQTKCIGIKGIKLLNLSNL